MNNNLSTQANNVATLNNITKYADLETYCREHEILYKKQCTVYEGYVVDIDYLKKDNFKDVVTAIAKLERNSTVAEHLIQNLFVATNTYGKPFEITIRAYFEVLKAYPTECLKEVLDCKKYTNFPCIVDILKTIKQSYPLIEEVINPNSNIYQHE